MGNSVILMLFSKRKPALTRQEQLASRPVQLVTGELTPTADGGGKLKIKLGQKRVAGWLLRMPAGATKTFEFDALGKFVWDHCDGKTNVGQISRKLAKLYKISEREAHVATEKFLVMLARKGLIGAAVKTKDDSKVD
jgi:Coenzyme PQQ synthesis protein D (PqqD)